MKNFNLILTILVFSFQILIAASSDPVFGENGMIVSTSKQASEAGIEILKIVKKMGKHYSRIPAMLPAEAYDNWTLQ